MSPAAALEHVGPALAAASVRGAAILLAALLLTWLLRRHSAAARHAIWAGAIVMQLLVLALAAWGPRWHVALPHAVTDAVSPIVAIPVAERTAPAPADRVSAFTSTTVVTPPPTSSLTVSAASSAEVLTPPPPVASRVNGRTLLLTLWALGALVVLLRLVVGTIVVAALARRGARVDDGGWLSLTQRLATSLGIERPLTLMRGSRVGVPITWGIIYPVVLLPDDADAWTEERRRFVLVHEMAHVKRLDALTQLVGQLALALFWFDPLVWIANRRMQMEREHACDDYVLRHGTAPSLYAEELLAMVRRLGTPARRDAQPAFAALAMARRSEFEGRMLSILDPVLDRHPLSGARTAMSIAAALLVVVPLAALQPYQAPAVPAAPAAPVAAAAATAQRPAPAAPASPAYPALPAMPSPVMGRAAAAATPFAPLAPMTSSASTPVAAPAAPAAPSAPNVVLVQGRDCANARLGSPGTITSIHSDHDDDENAGIIEYYSFTGSRCSQATIAGRVSYTADESDVSDMSDEAHAFFRERTDGDDRSLSIHRMDGTLVRSYRHNGASVAWDDDGRRWLARFLPQVLADAGLNVKPRVARWFREGGVDGALRGIAALHGSGAKASHFSALLAYRLSADDVAKVVRQAGHDLPSSGDLSAVLTQAAPALRNTAAAVEVMRTIATIPSSGDRAAVLSVYGQTDNRDALLALARVAAGLPSSGDRAGVLASLAPRYLAGNDGALRDAWFGAAGTIPSSGDKAGLLGVAIGYAARSDDDALAVIRVARQVASSGDRAGVLSALANTNALRSTAVRDAYLQAVHELPSSSDERRALEALSRP